MRKYGLRYLIFSLIFVALVSCVAALSTRAKAPSISESNYAGTESCIKPECHSTQYENIKVGAHQKLFEDEQSARRACELCHGRSSLHVSDPKNHKLVLSFKRMGSQEASELCITCHNSGSLEQWFNSRHYQNGISCNTCHRSHGSPDKQLLKTDDPQLCMDHHSKVRQEFNLKYKHRLSAATEEAQNLTNTASEGLPELPPIESGEDVVKQVTSAKKQSPPKAAKCSACHSPHENFNTNAKYKVIVGACIGCHTKYAGPFEYSHKPVKESCITCHAPHGSNYPGLCKTAPTDLCPQCHSKKMMHPFYVLQQEPDPETFPEKCLKCHSMIHGSKFAMFRKFKPTGGPQLKGTSPRPQQGVQGPGGGFSNQ